MLCRHLVATMLCAVFVTGGCATTGDPSKPGWFSRDKYEKEVRPDRETALASSRAAGADLEKNNAMLVERRERLRRDISSLQAALEQADSDLAAVETASGARSRDINLARTELISIRSAASEAGHRNQYSTDDLVQREEELARLQRRADSLRRDVAALKSAPR